MSAAGIVCEYNPFHKGHLLHIEETRRALGQDCTVVCVMSGDFVQRGENALYSKFARAEAACRCGADLVLELPLPWCLSSAEGFARGAVSILSALGLDYISFGSEAGETAGLEKIAETLLNPLVTQEIKQLMARESSLSFAAARQQVLENRLGETALLIASPNNILGVEYIKAIYELDLKLKPFTLARVGNAHDTEGDGEVKSASELRKLMRQGKDVSRYIPPQALEVYRREREQGRVPDAQRLELALLSRLRLLSREECVALPDAGDGLGNRLWKACMQEQSLDAILAATKSKRYAMARIRRMCISAGLGISAEQAAGLPGYTRVLASNEKGFAMLRGHETKEGFTVITKPAAAAAMSAAERKIFELGAAAHDLLRLAYPVESERKGGNDWRSSPFIVKNDQKTV